MSSGLFWPLDSETSGEVDPSDEPRRTAFTSGSCPGGQLELHDCLLWGDLCCGVFWSILAPPPAPVIMTRNVSRHTHTHTHTPFLLVALDLQACSTARISVLLLEKVKVKGAPSYLTL